MTLCMTEEILRFRGKVFDGIKLWDNVEILVNPKTGKIVSIEEAKSKSQLVNNKNSSIS